MEVEGVLSVKYMAIINKYNIDLNQLYGLEAKNLIAILRFLFFFYFATILNWLCSQLNCPLYTFCLVPRCNNSNNDNKLPQIEFKNLQTHTHTQTQLPLWLDPFQMVFCLFFHCSLEMFCLWSLILLICISSCIVGFFFFFFLTYFAAEKSDMK